MKLQWRIPRPIRTEPDPDIPEGEETGFTDYVDIEAETYPEALRVFRERYGAKPPKEEKSPK